MDSKASPSTWNISYSLLIALKEREESIVRLLLDRGANINTVWGEFGTALTMAAYGREMDLVRLLLDRGADVNMVGGKFGTALAAAAYTYTSAETSVGRAARVATRRVEKTLVRLLLDEGADINIVGGTFGTALAAAAHGGWLDMVSLLLDRGADVNIVGGEYGTALAAAALAPVSPLCEGMGIVGLLLDRGGDVNTVGGKYGTALAAAIYNCERDIVSLLLDRGADVNTVGGEFGTALAVAVYRDERNIVKLLLDRGADVNTVGDIYGTALAVAAYHGSMDFVLLLLDRGADVNTVGGEFGTALAAAVYMDKMKIVKLLLDRGANVNTVGGIYGTALTIAAYQSWMDFVLLLLDRGADVNTVGGEYGTALAAAVYRGQMDIVRLLLDRGADVNMVGGKYGTPLVVAVTEAAAEGEGGTGIVSLLLDRGASINMVSGEYGTALAAAAAGWSPHTALLLLERGASISMIDEVHTGALFAAAAFEGITNIVSLLLDRGTDVNMDCGKFGTALAAAVSGGRTDIASLLLERGARRADVTAVTRVCGSYSTAIVKQSGPGNQLVYPDDNEIAWPPFPMPYTGPNHHNITPSSGLRSLDILSTEFCAGGNLTPGQAGVPCSMLKEEVLWNSLAALVGLHDDITLAKHQWIRYDLCYFVTHNFDFGLAYAAARVAWRHFKHSNNSMDPSVIFAQRSRWHGYTQALEEIYSKAIKIDSNYSSSAQELIESPYSITPRRLWDLKSNRVVDFRVLFAALEIRPIFWAITHSWTSDMTPVSTAINQFQWPVPLPKNITLEYLRSELLALGAEYIWLDVICLRQKSEVDSLEQLRQQEWKLDVPTIGNTYRAAAKIVRYFNGLGVPFSNDGWDGSRHWLCRAWTLQEIASEKNTINCGISRDESQRWVFLNSQGTVLGKLVKFRNAIGPVLQLAAQVDSKYGCEIYELAREMARRQSTKPVDKISGLFYLLHTTKLPCYDEHKPSEDVWRQCFHLLPLERRAEILFNFPYRGSDEQWFPTWAQVLNWPTRDPDYNHLRSHILQDSEENTPGETSFIRNIWTIPGVTLCESNYPGEYGVKTNGRLFGFYFPYLEQKPIDIQDPVLTLATLDIGEAYNWVVCKALGEKAGKSVGLDGVAEVNVLRKIGVLRTDSCSELIVGGQNGASLLQKMNCLFV